MSKYKAVIFDLDGTLAESKQRVSLEMAQLLGILSETHLVAIISGGDWPQYIKQLVPELTKCNLDLSNFIFCPTCATKMYVKQSDNWNLLYSLDLSSAEKDQIREALEVALDKTKLRPSESWGERLEDRGTQLTFSALGQEAPLEAKRSWDPDFSKRKRIKAELDLLLPNFSVRLGGTTSIDITALGVDKAYGLERIAQHTNIKIADMLYVGDAIFPDGNDYPVVNTGCDFVCVDSVEQTKKTILDLINLD